MAVALVLEDLDNTLLAGASSWRASSTGTLEIRESLEFQLATLVRHPRTIFADGAIMRARSVSRLHRPRCQTTGWSAKAITFGATSRSKSA